MMDESKGKGRATKTVDLVSLKVYLMEHKVPEEKIRTATARICALDLEVARLYQKIKAAGDARTANMALKKAKKIVRRVEDIIAELMEDAKHEVMSKNARKKGGEDEHE